MAGIIAKQGVKSFNVFIIISITKLVLVISPAVAWR
jgi:hypothetical protein